MQCLKGEQYTSQVILDRGKQNLPVQRIEATIIAVKTVRFHICEPKIKNSMLINQMALCTEFIYALATEFIYALATVLSRMWEKYCNVH